MRYIIFFLLLQYFTASSQSSFYQDIGKNRIQYKSFKWKVIYSNNFELYFNEGSENIANEALKFIEKKFPIHSSEIGHLPFKKSKIFIYNSIIDLEQSNIGINENNEFLNTNSNYNNKIQFKVAFQNNMNQFKKDLSMGICKILIEDLMKGNVTFTKRFGRASFTTIPKWFSEGAARYLAYGWDSEMDNRLRDYFRLSDKKTINKVNNDKSEFIGQSIWNFIAIEYGKSNISNILNLTKIIRNPEKSMSSALGVSFDELIMMWSEFYNSSENFEDVESFSNLKTKKVYKDLISVKSNDENSNLALVLRKSRVTKIILHTPISGKFKVLEKLRNKKSFYKNIDWIDNSTISYLKEQNGKINLVNYNIYSKRKSFKDLSKFQSVNGYSYNTNKSLIALSGSIENQKDIYLLSASSNNLAKITDDKYDDIHPKFFPNSTSIIYSSNRKKDDESNTNYLVDDNYNLYIHNLDTTRGTPIKISNNIQKNIIAHPISTNQIIYSSDMNGIVNLYSHKIGESHKQITNMNSSILSFDYNKTSENLIFNTLSNDRIKAFIIDKFNIDEIKSGSKTSRIVHLESHLKEKNELEFKTKEKVKNEIDFSDTDDFSFEGDINNNTSIRNNLNQSNRGSNRLPYDYKYSFLKNNFNSFVLVDPLEGFGTQIETDFIELFENQNLYAKAFLPLSRLKSSDIFAEYSYLKKRIDFRLSFDRNIIFPEDNENYIYHKYSKNELRVNISYPLSNYLRIEASPFLSFNKFYDLDYRVLNSSPPPFNFYEKTNFRGYLINILMDNTNKLGMNLEIGTKMKLVFGNYLNSKNKDKDFKDFYVDIIHHQRLFNNIIFSSKIFYGNSFGNNPFKYLVGGIKNSVINTKEDKGINDPLLIQNGGNNSNFLYSRFLNLRGYNLKKFDGYKALVLNTELKIPLLKTMIGNSITSNFLNNLQLIGFFDIGSSWNVNSPFSSKSDVNTWLIQDPGSVFQAEIENSKNPWLASYGFGIRSFFMDYFIKLDIAKPIEDYRIGQTKVHLSLGYSF